jgi:hypothetical protein
MTPNFPAHRFSTVKKWPEPFLQNAGLQSFHLVAHGVSLCFQFNNPDFLKALQKFFPREWQRQEADPIQVDWREPYQSEKPLWDEITNPDCQFFNDFISQRDFLTRRINRREYQLMAFQQIDDGLFNFLRFLLPVELLTSRQILFHSSCVVDQAGQAYLFFGPSGAGKTTIAQLCQEAGANILGDDMNLIRAGQNSLTVEAAAVGQRHFQKENFGIPFPVKKVFWLQKGLVNRVREMGVGQMGLLLSSFSNLFWDQLTPLQYEKVFQTLALVNTQVDLHELEFKKDKEIWNYVQSL